MSNSIIKHPYRDSGLEINNNIDPRLEKAINNGQDLRIKNTNELQQWINEKLFSLIEYAIANKQKSISIYYGESSNDCKLLVNELAFKNLTYLINQINGLSAKHTGKWWIQVWPFTSSAHIKIKWRNK